MAMFSCGVGYERLGPSRVRLPKTKDKAAAAKKGNAVFFFHSVLRSGSELENGHKQWRYPPFR